MKPLRTAALSLVVLVALATPAGATTGALAEAQPWHYWISWVLALSALFVVFVVLPIGYYVKVVRLKRGR